MAERQRAARRHCSGALVEGGSHAAVRRCVLASTSRDMQLSNPSQCRLTCRCLIGVLAGIDAHRNPTAGVDRATLN
jgi:hypothetical protein